MDLHQMLDVGFGEDGLEVLGSMLDSGADPNAHDGPFSETALHVATRRRRPAAVELLIDRGADVEAVTSGGKTAYAHARRRTFDDVVEVLIARGARTTLNLADTFAAAVVEGRLDDARAVMETDPRVVRTGNPEEDRLLADVAGRAATEPVELLIGAGADLAAPGLDFGTPLHQAAWFGQPDNARFLIDAGAPLDVFDATHGASPIGWVAHGSRYSGAAAERQDVYVALTRMLLDAGAVLHQPSDPESDVYLQYLLTESSPEVAAVFRAILERFAFRRST